MAGNVMEFNDANFQTEVLQNSEPVLVDFWAPWCGPCRQIAPMVEQLAEEYQGSVKIGKLNIDDSPESPSSYGVSGIPTLMVFKGRPGRGPLCGRATQEPAAQALDAAKG